MKRLLLAFALAVMVVVALPLAATASHSNGTGPKFEKADGTGESPEYGRVHVNAKDQGVADGHFFIGPASGPVEVQGDVTCLRVTGNVALVGGLQRETGMPFLIEVTDNGSPGHGADRHRWRMAMPNEVTGQCADYGDNPPPATIVQGNYIVHGP